LRLFNTTPAVHGDKVAAALDGARGRPVTSIPIEVPLALCEAAPRARAIDDGAVRVLAASIAETGLLSPITVRRAISSRSGEACEAFEVVAGLHRVKAFRRLGRETIPAFVVEFDDLRAELALIDENLCRNDLTPAERAAATARRKAIHIEMHGSPMAKGAHAANAAMGHEHDASAKLADAFTIETAHATGRSERSVQRDAHRGAALGDDVLRVARTSLDKGDELDALAKMPAQARAALIERAAAGEKVSAKIEAKKIVRAEREAALAEKPCALPARKFGVIYAASDLDAIKARDVASIAADDCVLFLWSPANRVADAIDVMRGWGFAYVSQIVWGKTCAGTGYWVRDKHEALLIGKRGAPPAPAMGTQCESLIVAPATQHSAKPEIFLEIIERYFPHLPKIELNRGGPARPKWSAWGNEAEAPDAASGDDDEAAAVFEFAASLERLGVKFLEWDGSPPASAGVGAADSGNAL
jgi:ParB/RepB/Spo0J family partition protein